MLRFLAVRLLTGLVVLWLITMAVFALFFVAPNNVARTLGRPPGDSADARADQPPAGPGPADLEAVPRRSSTTRCTGTSATTTTTSAR